MERIQTENTWHAVLDKSGRILIPAELRHKMRANPGSHLLWEMDDAGLHLRRFEESLAEIQGYYQGLGPADELWSDEIIEQRRLEARND